MSPMSLYVHLIPCIGSTAPMSSAMANLVLRSSPITAPQMLPPRSNAHLARRVKTPPDELDLRVPSSARTA